MDQCAIFYLNPNARIFLIIYIWTILQNARVTKNEYLCDFIRRA